MQQDRFSSIHEHCSTCFSWKCEYIPDYVTSCELIECEYGCKKVFHACKQGFHRSSCVSKIVPCTNKQYGCHQEIRKSNMAVHLRECPANVVYCPHGPVFDWNGDEVCQKAIRREEFSTHTRTHIEFREDITIKCPLSYLGCDKVFQKRTPLIPNSEIVYSSLQKCYGLRFNPLPLAIEKDHPNGPLAIEKDNPNGPLATEKYNPNGPLATEKDNTNGPLATEKYNPNGPLATEKDNPNGPLATEKLNPNGPLATEKDNPNGISEEDINSDIDQMYLEDLPDNVLEYIILLLDSFSINNISVTCKMLRRICGSVLYKRGMVQPVWIQNGKQWILQTWKWCFSCVTSPVIEWKYHLNTSLANHIANCSFYPERIPKDDIIQCPNKCGFSFHSSQLNEHLGKCILEKVTCINKSSGCDAFVLRSKMAAHLRVCPANIVQCNAFHMRPEMNGKCQNVFRRNEINGHYKFTHLDICDTSLKCPLESNGCSFKMEILTPVRPNTQVIFDPDSRNFNIRETEDNTQNAIVKNKGDNLTYQRSSDISEFCYLETIPNKVLHYILSYLDSASLRSLSTTSTEFRKICQHMLTEKGVVEPIWQKSNNGWIISKRKWYFSSACSPVKKWERNLRTPISEHLKVCEKFKDKNIKTDKVLVMFDMNKV